MIHPFHYSNITYTNLMTSTTSFDNTSLHLLNLSLCSEESAQLQIRILLQISSCLCHTRFLANLRARLSLLFLNNSMIRFSYGAVLRIVSTFLEARGRGGGIPNDFLDEGSDSLGLLREISLSAGWTRRKLTSLNDMAFVHANSNAYKTTSARIPRQTENFEQSIMATVSSIHPSCLSVKTRQRNLCGSD
jgi:hypothetical protein